MFFALHDEHLSGRIMLVDRRQIRRVGLWLMKEMEVIRCGMQVVADGSCSGKHERTVAGDHPSTIAGIEGGRFIFIFFEARIRKVRNVQLESRHQPANLLTSLSQGRKMTAGPDFRVFLTPHGLTGTASLEQP
jgi:hypothetical protein